MNKQHTPKAHKNAEVIKAFADGKAIQYFDTWRIKWVDFCFESDEGPWVDTEDNWRVKPEGPWYRVAAMKQSGTTFSLVANSEYTEAHLESEPTFVRWLTERVSYEV